MIKNKFLCSRILLNDQISNFLKHRLISYILLIKNNSSRNKFGYNRTQYRLWVNYFIIEIKKIGRTENISGKTIASTGLFFKKQSPCKLQRNFSKSVRRSANLLYSAVQKYATFSIKQATNNYVYYLMCYNYNNDMYYYYLLCISEII